jgi:hypothetical protein
MLKSKKKYVVNYRVYFVIGGAWGIVVVMALRY